MANGEANWQDLLDQVDVPEVRARALRSDIADPYSVYRELREHTPVYEGDVLLDIFNVPSLAQPIRGTRPVFTVTRWDDCCEVLRDHQTFSSTLLIDVLGPSMGINMLLVDPPEHTRLRQPVRLPFGRRNVERWRDDFVKPVIERDFLRPIIPAGRAELMRDLAIPLPISVVYRILGLPPDRIGDFHSLAMGLSIMPAEPELGVACSEALGVMLSELIEDRRKSPRDDLVSEVLALEAVTPDHMTHDELLSFLRVLLSAGAETTTANLGPLFAALLAHPDQLDMVRDNPELVAAAVEEALRWEAPNQFTYRITTRDTVVNGVHMPKGAGIVVAQGAANRDPSRWVRPDEFDITRPRQAHLAFGVGVHNCIGAAVARMEVEEATRLTLELLPGLRADPAQPAPVIGGVWFRAPVELPVVWDAES